MADRSAIVREDPRLMQLALNLNRERKTLEERFHAYHKANPQVYAELVALARQAKAKGVDRIGIAMLWETVRWSLSLQAAEKNDTGPRLNNSYRSRYARLIMDQELDLRDVFALRKLTVE